MRFQEEQRVGGGWRWFWAAVVLGPTAVAAVVLLVVVGSDNLDPMLALAVIGPMLIFELGLFIAILRTPVRVEVADDGVRVRVPPFMREHIPPTDIATLEEVTSGLRRRYGIGVGKKGVVKRARYTVGNDAGVVIERTNGWTIIIGSERPAELAEAIRATMPRPGWT